MQQVDDPLDALPQPANQFVAAFIGSPPMNLLPAQVAADGSVRLGSGDGGGSFAPRPALPALLARAGRAATLGVRPEDLGLRASGDGGSLPATLEVREPLGSETLLYWSTPAGNVVSRLGDEPTPSVGESATLHFRGERLRWFDPETEMAID